MSNLEPTAPPPGESTAPLRSAASEELGRALAEPVLFPAEQSPASSTDAPTLLTAGKAQNASTASTIAPDHSAEECSGPPPRAPVDVLNAPKPRGRPFQPGQSGNPLGKPKGARNRATLAVEALIHGKAEELAGKAIDLALAGDSTLIRALLGTVAPPRRDRLVEFELPNIESAADVLAASSAIVAATANGQLTPSEAREMMALLAIHVRTVEAADVEARLLALEKALHPSSPPAATASSRQVKPLT